MSEAQFWGGYFATLSQRLDAAIAKARASKSAKSGVVRAPGAAAALAADAGNASTASGVGSSPGGGPGSVWAGPGAGTPAAAPASSESAGAGGGADVETDDAVPERVVMESFECFIHRVRPRLRGQEARCV